MSSKQGVSKDQDELARERSIAKQKAAEKREEEEKTRKSLLEAREKAKEKLNTVIKTKQPKGTFLNLTQHQMVFIAVGVVMLVLVILPFMGENVATSNLVIDQARIAAFNKDNKGFRLDSNEFFEGWTLPDAEAHMAGITNKAKFETCPELQIENLPKKYSSRTKQTLCITPTYDQGKCSSSYAFAITGMMTNRYCLQHSGTKKFDASPQFIVSSNAGKGCNGGDLGEAAKFVLKEGIVNTMCQPYNPERLDSGKANLDSCFRLRISKLCTTNEVEQIKRHIYKSGPVASLLKASRELLVYKGGVYDASKGNLVFTQPFSPKALRPSRSSDGTPIRPPTKCTGSSRTHGEALGVLLVWQR